MGEENWAAILFRRLCLSSLAGVVGTSFLVPKEWFLYLLVIRTDCAPEEHWSILELGLRCCKCLKHASLSDDSILSNFKGEFSKHPFSEKTDASVFEWKSLASLFLTNELIKGYDETLSEVWNGRVEHVNDVLEFLWWILSSTEETSPKGLNILILGMAGFSFANLVSNDLLAQKVSEKEI